MKRQRLRNRVTGFLFGKYNIEKLGKSKLIHEERYISGVEIINYNEIMIIISFVLLILTVFLNFLSPWYNLTLILPLILIYFSLDLELVMLTDERVIIEKRGVIEKITRIKNETSLSLDQIAVFKYGRAPVNIALLAFTMISLTSITALLIVVELQVVFIVLNIILLIILLMLLWYSLRLNKRSIELSVIGVKTNIGIGRNKGVPYWFMSDTQETVFERIHHTVHEGKKSGLRSDIREFPLQFSTRAKDYISQLDNILSQHIIKFLDHGDKTLEQIDEYCSEFDLEDIKIKLRVLRMKRYIDYDDENQIWKMIRKN